MSQQGTLFDTIIQLMEAENQKRLVPNPLYMKYNYTTGNEGVATEGSGRDQCSEVYRRSTHSSDADMRQFWKDWYHGINFVEEFFQICQQRRDRRAIAYRPIRCIAKESVEGFLSPMEVTHFSPTKYVTFGELYDTIINFGKGLVTLGEKAGNTVCIFLETRWEWMVFAFGIWSQRMVLGTVFANLGADAIGQAFAETGCTTVITVASKVPMLVEMMRTGAMQKVRIIVVEAPTVIGGATEPMSPVAPGSPVSAPSAADLAEYTILDWQDVVTRGAESDVNINMPDDEESLALIMYTSGTTGEPKGVMHTYGSLTAGAKVFYNSIDGFLAPQQEDDTYVSSMPLAHIFEFFVTLVFMLRGDLVCFGSPRTLADTFARPHGDHKEFKPCFLVGVPRIFDMIKKAAETKLSPQGTLERAIYEHAFKTKEKYMREGFDTPFWNDTVFAPLREVTGGRVRSAFGGGGPVSVPTQTFINVVMFRLQQGWGMTESCGTGNKQLTGDLDTFCIGPPELACELRLFSRDGYTTADKPEPRGELCIRGPMMFKGYYKKPELTKESFDEDGFFHTGDVAALTTRGRFRIVGRVKALAKNSVGEYIPMEALESLYADCPLCVPNGVCIIVHPHRNYIAAIACTDEDRVARFLKETGQGRRAETMQWPFILEEPDFQKEVDETFAQLARRARRGTQEIVRRVCLVPHAWTPENGVLTAAGKLKRHVVEERYKETIEFLFKEER